MTKRIAFTIVLVLLLAPAAALAQIQQVGIGPSASDARSTVNFSLGYFALKGLDARPADDVLVGDLVSAHPLFFEVKELNPFIAGGEYLFAVNRNLEVGVGIAIGQRTAHSVYADLTHSDGSEIAQDIKLRQVPVTFTGRYLFLPKGGKVEPYVGAGLVAIRYHYSEVGEFVDADGTVFPGVYAADGTVVGPLVLGGVSVPVQNWTVGGEVRWQKAEAHGLADLGFLGDTLDLGGWYFNFTFGVRF
jgi:outer membrane protein W